MLRLIGFIIAFAVFLVFIILNLGNTCNISFGFYVLQNAPVSLTALVSFFLGMICTIPVLITLRNRKKLKEPGFKELSPKEIEPKETSSKRFWGKKEKKQKKKESSEGQSSEVQKEEIPKENGPYGID